MSEKRVIKPFQLIVRDVFHLSDGSTVFVGPLEGGGNTLTPCMAELQVQGESPTSIHLAWRRMPGNLPKGYRVVCTLDAVDLTSDAVKTKRCKLILRSEVEL